MVIREKVPGKFIPSPSPFIPDQPKEQWVIYETLCIPTNPSQPTQSMMSPGIAPGTQIGTLPLEKLPGQPLSRSRFSKKELRRMTMNWRGFKLLGEGLLTEAACQIQDPPVPTLRQEVETSEGKKILALVPLHHPGLHEVNMILEGWKKEGWKLVEGAETAGLLRAHHIEVVHVINDIYRAKVDFIPEDNGWTILPVYHLLSTDALEGVLSDVLGKYVRIDVAGNVHVSNVFRDTNYLKKRIMEASTGQTDVMLPEELNRATPRRSLRETDLKHTSQTTFSMDVATQRV